jgi:hypothetical protein
VAWLREHLIAFFGRDRVAGELRVPYHRQHLRDEIFASCEVLGERYQADAVIFDVRPCRRARPAARPRRESLAILAVVPGLDLRKTATN